MHVEFTGLTMNPITQEKLARKMGEQLLEDPTMAEAERPQLFPFGGPSYKVFHMLGASEQ